MADAWDAAADAYEAAVAEGRAALAYGELPVASRDPAELADYVPDPHGGRLRMGAQTGWSPAREGFAAPPRPPEDPPPGSGRPRPRWDLAGSTVVQPVVGCSECGGIVATACDVATRQPVEYAWRSDVDPAYRPLGPEQTCAGCLRQGEPLARRVRAAEVARSVAEARRAEDGDPWAWTRRTPVTDPAAADAGPPSGPPP